MEDVNKCLQIKERSCYHMKQERDKIKVVLARNNLPSVWLLNRLEESGIVTDSTSLSSVLRGRRRGPKAETIITGALKIIEDYERKFCT